MDPFAHLKPKDGEQPRALTREEVRDLFMEQAVAMMRYWQETDLQRDFATKQDEINQRCHGLLFSILNILDGNSGFMPGFLVVASPHESDEPYHRDEGRNWFPPVPEGVEEKVVDIGGALHEVLRNYIRE